MSTPDTLLFLGLLALAYWLKDTRLQVMAGTAGVAAGLSAAALAPAPWVGLAVLGMGAYQLVVTIRAIRARRRAGGQR